MTAAGGFLLASKGHIQFGLLLETLFGLALVIASGCVANNYLDRDIDKFMTRTKKRATATGRISSVLVISYTALLGLLGIALLIKFTTWWAVGLAVAGWIIYVVIYTPLKRMSVHGTIFGSIAGAVPPAVGYCAVTGRFDFAALLLILVLVFWQMPHFYAIAIYRKKDYASADIPVLPIVLGNVAAKKYITGYIAAFLAAAVLLTINGYTGIVYLLIMVAVSIYWLKTALGGFETKNDSLWARKTFLFSLIVLLIFSLSISLDNWLP